MRSRLIVHIAAVAAVPLAGRSAPPPDEAPPPDVYRPASRPLDPRVDPSRITEQPPPPLPEAVLLPLPPAHRIAVDPGSVPIDRGHWDVAQVAIARGLASLRRTQHASGGWMVDATAQPTSPGAAATADAERPPSPVAAAVTALAVKALAQVDSQADAGDALDRGLRFVLRASADDGSFAGGTLTSYVTATVVSALSAVDEHAFGDRIARGVGWLRTSQWDQTEGIDPRQDWFGGAGYGKQGRPDLSNTQMMLEALYDAGLSPDEPPFQRALAFVTRTQNLGSTNDADWAGRDGGFVYTPAGGGESMASEHAGEGRSGEQLPPGAPRSLRSYGSMTYAGFKSLLYAGLSPDDERVRSAFDWIRRHWTFEENPGLGRQGLYYYYHAMARALRVAQQQHVRDIDGGLHNWREELIDAIARRQAGDGSWRNDSDRWLEGEPVMATVYALLALEEALKPVSGSE